MDRDARTSEHDGATPLDWFAAETSVVEASSLADASSAVRDVPVGAASDVPGASPDLLKHERQSPLDWFATEASLVCTLSASDTPDAALPEVVRERALPEFPGEQVRATVDGLAETSIPIESSRPADAVSTQDAYAIAAPLGPEIPLASTDTASGYPASNWLPAYTLAATLVAGLGVGWWAAAILDTRPVAVDAGNPAPAVAPAVVPRVDAGNRAPTELLSSIHVRPSTRVPIARVAADAPRIAEEPRQGLARDRRIRAGSSFVGTARELRQPAGSEVAKGLSDGKLTARAPTVVPRMRTEPSPPAAPTAANPRSPSPVSEPLPAPAPSIAASTALPPSLGARSEPVALRAVAERTEQSEIQRVLSQYRTAYQLLDAEAARAVWPSVDARALARAFNTLSSQELAFEVCEFEIAGETGTARCQGSATYTPKVGSSKPRLEPRRWTFHLRKMDESWKIQSAQIRR